MIADRIDRRNTETVTDGAVGCATAALHHDVVLVAEIHDVPNDQKISGKTKFGNKRQFFIQLLFHCCANGGIALLRAK